MVQYYNTGDKDSTNLIAYASDLSMFAMLFTDMQNGTRDYGNDRPIKSVEVAILSTIEQNPGITVSDLSQKQHRTKGTISSIVSNLEKGGYIYREKRPGNAKVVHLYTTPDGERLNTLYIAFVTKKNNRDTVRTIKGLLYLWPAAVPHLSLFAVCCTHLLVSSCLSIECCCIFCLHLKYSCLLPVHLWCSWFVFWINCYSKFPHRVTSFLFT